MSARKPKRRFLRYSLRTMLVVVLVLSVWLGYMANQAAKQRRAVEVLEAMEPWGAVHYDYKYDASDLRMVPTSKDRHEPEFLGMSLGAIWPRPVLWVDLRGNWVNNKDLAQVVTAFPQVEYLSLHGASINDDGVRGIASLRRLRFLILSDTQISDIGLCHIPNGNLEYLALDSTRVTDQGMVEIRRLGGLKRIDLDYTEISDAGISHLAHLPDLDVITISGTNVTLEGAQQLRARRPKLKIYGISEELWR